MELGDSSLPPQPQPPPFALAYSTLRPSRPGVLSVAAVMGIVVASLGLLASASGVLSAVGMSFMNRAMPMMRMMSPGALAVTIGDAVIGAALAGMLLTGSIGLQRLRPWSRRVLLWWAGVYLLNVAVYLVLSILVLVPSQIAMMSNMMSRSFPATAPIATVATAGSAGATTTFVTSTSTTIAFTPNGPAGAQFALAPMMQAMYIGMAVGWAIVRVIFPIFILIVMQLKNAQSVFGPFTSQHGDEHLTV